MRPDAALPDVRFVAAQLAMARNARVEREEELRRRAARLSAALGCVAAALAAYDVTLLALALNH